MVGIVEHKALMKKVKKEIGESKGIHRKDLIRYYNKLKKELSFAEEEIRKTAERGMI